MFDLDGNFKQQVQLPAGVKTLVSDTRWLYAGCDNGGVYDLTDPQHPRLAYVLPTSATATPSIDDIDDHDENAMDVDGAPADIASAPAAGIPRKHVTFVVDCSSSMRGALIDSAVRNVSSIISCQLQDDDLVSLVKFNSAVTPVFSAVSKRDNAENIAKSVQALLGAPSGTTALWAAFAKGFEIAKNTPMDVDQWVVLLTDGENNVHTGFDAAAIAALAGQSDARVIAISVGSATSADKMQAICAASTTHGFLSKHVSVSATPHGVDEAFKVVAQMLNARVTSLAIADGLVSITDANGSITVCNIDGVKLWAHQGATPGGWMVRADSRSAYQGNDTSIIRYNLRNGELESQSPLDAPVFSGCQTPDSLFIAAGSGLYHFSKLTNSTNAVASVAPAVVLANAAGMIDGSVFLFTADSTATISCFEWDPADPARAAPTKWQMSCSDIGTPLSMQVFGNRLYAVTANGFLASIDVSPAATASGAPTIVCAVKTVTGADVTVPLQKLPTTNDASLGVVVECQRELECGEILEIHRAIHDRSVDHIVVRGKNYPIQVAQAKKLRYVAFSNLKFMEQNPAKTGKYGQMARSGRKITWCISGHSPRWGLVLDNRVESDFMPTKMRIVSDGFNKNWDVQFPIVENSQRVGARFVVEQIFPAENGEYYRTAGKIAQLR